MPRRLSGSACSIRYRGCDAMHTVRNAIHEEDFLGFSYGFRPGLSQYDALYALSVAISGTPVNWISARHEETA